MDDALQVSIEDLVVVVNPGAVRSISLSACKVL